jgi:hypothetical protein
MADDERTMFEIYRERDYNRAFHCIFYTELDEHLRDAEIAKAAAGETVYTGFVTDARKEEARDAVLAIVDELNDMDEDEAGLPSGEIERRLSEFLVAAPGE